MTTPTPTTVSSRLAGPCSRFRVDVFRGRDGALSTFVLDAELVDPETGLPAVVFQGTAEDAAAFVSKVSDMLEIQESLYEEMEAL